MVLDLKSDFILNTAHMFNMCNISPSNRLSHKESIAWSYKTGH